ncbi:MAG TPA: sulfotransferase [Lacipirellulaceae bacterium]|nr:sulfotransferase [Lacipirellulaceae bacterium]HMP04862.1 sulfotransferase [Lacipirellulaceae bacterium]
MKPTWLEANLWLGIGSRAWWRLLVRNRLAIRPARMPMAAVVTAAAAGNSLLGGVQSLLYGRRIRQVAVPDNPVFIVGHWRTGTTMLHELLALDPRHRAPTTYESLSPHHFLLTERLVRRFARWLLPGTRPFDNMRMSFDRPQEDEAALALRGVPSPFLAVAFPRRPLPWPEYVDLDGLSPRQLADWQQGMRRLLKLLLVRRPGRLVLKSPQHTNRIRLLSQMFPAAQFVYLVRDPYAVFPSTVHFWRTMYQRYGLQRFDETRLREQVLHDFAHMHQRVEQARAQLAPARLHEVRYEQLAADPLAEVERLYAALQLGDFEPARPAVAQYAERSRRYKTNDYDLDGATRREIAARWAPYFQRHGYDA